MVGGTQVPTTAIERELTARIESLESEVRRHREASLTARLHLSNLDLGGTDGRIVERVIQVLKEAVEG
ncbi:MAG TPA: hypothetical protein PLI83_02730 [Thermomonas sp.]|nr:hypothetical protein [Thermomonas sp.]